MTTKEQSSQLRLAADILETGHPWELQGVTEWHSCSKYPSATPIQCIFHGQAIRPILATPPDGRELHNPDKLTAEQVGVGKRLTLKNEPPHDQAELWMGSDRAWKTRCPGYENRPYEFLNTYRLPLSVPWPELPDPYTELKAAHAAGKVIECKQSPSGNWLQIRPNWSAPVEDYRIKPEPEFTLPQPPPGIQWHDDGWKADMLPQGFRPLYIGERICKDDEYFAWNEGPWKKAQDAPRGEKSGKYIDKDDVKYRTTRPLTFTHLGQTWTWHKPGDPRPCDGERKVHFMMVRDDSRLANKGVEKAGALRWSKSEPGESDIIGWRYAEPVTKTAARKEQS